MSDFNEQLWHKLPLDRKALFSELEKGCNSKLLRYLVARFWVNEETDPNDDLGFVFALTPTGIPFGEAGYFYKLYISCVLPYATLRFYTLNSEGNSTCSSVAVKQPFWERSAQLKQLRSMLIDLGYELLSDEQLSLDVSAEILSKLGLNKGNYFNLLFSEYS